MPFIKDNLEKLLGEEKFEKLKNLKIGDNKIYDGSIDAFALNTFSYPLALILEKAAAGFTWKTHLFTRGIALFTNTASAGKYERIRTRVFNKLNIDETTPYKRYLADTGLFLFLQVPLHCINMSIATLIEKGTIELEDMYKMASASLPLVPIAGFFGGPYGRYRDRLKKSADLPIEYSKKEKSKKQDKL